MQGLKINDGVLVKMHGDIIQSLLPDHVLVIGENAFEDCVSLVTIKLSKDLTTISKGAFSKCSKLTRVVFPNTIKTIEDGAFAGCSNLDDNALITIKRINPNALV